MAFRLPLARLVLFFLAVFALALGVLWGFGALWNGLADSGSGARADSERHPVRVSKAPVRGEVGPLRLERTGFTYSCMECHQSIETRRGPKRLLAEHEDIILDHGRNNDCLNCHHPENRDAYVDYADGEISSKTPQLLCAKCHGPTYRDWEAGIHGRRSGHWDLAAGEQKRLACIQCHDPHRPQFAPMAPMPGPAYASDTEKGGSH